MDSTPSDNLPNPTRQGRSGGEVIALLIMGIGLLTTGFFSGWAYFRVQAGTGVTRGKELRIPMGITPIGNHEDLFSILSPDNLSWQVDAPKGKFGLIIQFKANPSQGISLDLKEGTRPARLALIRQKLPNGEETWTLAVGSPEKPSEQLRQTIKVLPKGEEKPISREASVPFSNKESVELATMKWNLPLDAPADAPLQASLIWYPASQ